MPKTDTNTAQTCITHLCIVLTDLYNSSRSITNVMPIIFVAETQPFIILANIIEP